MNKTIENERKATLQRLRISVGVVSDQITEVNKILADDELEFRENLAIAKLNEMDENLKELNSLEHKFAVLEAGSLFECVKQYSYACSRVKQNTDDNGLWVSIELETISKVFSLETATSILNPFGCPREWITKASVASFYFAYESGKRHGVSDEEIIKLNTSFRMKKIARQCVETGVNPCSKTQMRNTLQGVIDALLGETAEKYKVNNYDVEYMRTAFTGKGKGQCKLSLATGKKFNALIMEVATRLVNGLKYSFDDKVFAREPHETPIVEDINTAFTVTETPTEIPAEAPAEPTKARRGRKTKAE